MIIRQITDQLVEEIKNPEITIIAGPRRIGKTTLMNALEQKAKPTSATLYIDFTDSAAQALWENFSLEKIRSILNELGPAAKPKVIFFDEIQYLPESGKMLKLIYDHCPGVKVFASGSSSFLLLQSIGESLAGRKKVFTLYPLSLSETDSLSITDYWKFNPSLLQADKLSSHLSNILVYGSYPGIFLTEEPAQKIEKLKDISDSILFKDLLVFEHIKKPRMLVELAKLLAYQVGNLVNPNELATTLGISRKTVLDYIELLERFYVIQRIYPYERNLRDVIKKQFKVYFIDNGIRNAIIGDFRHISQRNDAGALLENIIVIGLQRRISYERLLTELYFWHDYAGKEIDVLIKNQDDFRAIEVKSRKSRAKISKSFLKHFPKTDLSVVNFDTAYRFCL